MTAYNHNLDTSPEFYPKVTSSRNYEDRLNTIAAVRDAGISVCCGGILGLGEEERDRASLLRVLANLPEHPESVPINALVPVKVRDVKFFFFFKYNCLRGKRATTFLLGKTPRDVIPAGVCMYSCVWKRRRPRSSSQVEPTPGNFAPQQKRRETREET